MAALTAPQQRALEVLARLTTPPGEWPRRTVHARRVARELWPDSPAWGQTTHRRGAGGGGPGTPGGTMPMKAGTLLGRLEQAGVAEVEDRAWQVTHLGLAVLAGTAEPRPVRRAVEAPVVRAPKPPRTRV